MAMTNAEHKLIVELALAVHAMAPPDRQRMISKAMDAWEAEAQAEAGPVQALQDAINADKEYVDAADIIDRLRESGFQIVKI